MKVSNLKKFMSAVLAASCIFLSLAYTVGAQSTVIVSGDPTGADKTAVLGKTEDDKALYLSVTSPSLYRTFYQVNPGSTYTNYKYLVYEANIAPVSGLKALYLQTASSARVSAKATAFNNNRWNHVMFVYEVQNTDFPKGRTTCYINGTAAFTNEVNLETFRGTDVRIALDSTLTQKLSDRQDLHAYIDDIKLYLTDDEPLVPQMPVIDGAAGNALEITEGETAEDILGGEALIRAYRNGDLSQKLSQNGALKYGDTVVLEYEGKYTYYTINIAGKKFLAYDAAGEGFSSSSEYEIADGVYGKKEGDISGKFSCAGAQTVYAEANAEDCTAEYSCLIAETNFMPEKELHKISLYADAAEISGADVYDGWVYGRWNNIRYAFDFENGRLFIYLNGRLISEESFTPAALIGAQTLKAEITAENTVYVDDFKVYYTNLYNKEPALPVISAANLDLRGDVVFAAENLHPADITAQNAEVTAYADSTFSSVLSNEAELENGNVLVIASNSDLYNYYFVSRRDTRQDTNEMNVTVRYNPDTNCLMISGKLASGKKEILSLKADPVIFGGTPLYYSFTSGEDGTINCTVPFGNKFIGKKYTYTLNAEKEIKKGEFSAVDGARLASFLSNINAAAGAAAVESEIRNTAPLIALDNGDNTKDFSYMAQLVYAMRPAGLYNSETVIDAYMLSEGMGYVKSGKITFAQFLSDYSQYLKADYTTVLNGKSDDIKAQMQTLFKNGLLFESFDKAFADGIWLSEYRLQETAASLGRQFLSYCSSNNVSLEDYNNLPNDYIREQIFVSMYQKRLEKYYVKDVTAEFSDFVKGGNSGGNPGGGGGGSGSGGGSNVSITQTGGAGSAQNPNSGNGLNDISTHWAKDAIKRIYGLGIINGFDDGSFKPDNSVTRAEFTKMAVLALEKRITLPSINGGEFSDVSMQSWYYGCVKKATGANIVNGYNGYFNPESTIKREDAAVMMYRCLQKIGKCENQADAAYDDKEDISEYAREAVSVLTSLGIVNGADNRFCPKNSITRAEAAAMTERFLDIKL